MEKGEYCYVHCNSGVVEITECGLINTLPGGTIDGSIPQLLLTVVETNLTLPGSDRIVNDTIVISKDNRVFFVQNKYLKYEPSDIEIEDLSDQYDYINEV